MTNEATGGGKCFLSLDLQYQWVVIPRQGPWVETLVKILLKIRGDNNHVSVAFKFLPQEEVFVFLFKMQGILAPKYP